MDVCGINSPRFLIRNCSVGSTSSTWLWTAHAIYGSMASTMTLVYATRSRLGSPSSWSHRPISAPRPLV